MCNKLEALRENYNQALQNFNYAKKEYIREAIFKLTISEFELKKQERTLRNGD